MDSLWPMRAHRGLLEMRDALEIRDGRQEMCDMPADQSLRPGHQIYGQLHDHSAFLRVPQPRSTSLASICIRSDEPCMLLIAQGIRWCSHFRLPSKQLLSTCREGRGWTTWQAPKHTLMTSSTLMRSGASQLSMGPQLMTDFSFRNKQSARNACCNLAQPVTDGVWELKWSVLPSGACAASLILS